MLTIILLPGMDGTGDLFAPFAAALGSRFNVITVRYPVTEALKYEELEEIARQSLPSHGDYIILGESFSGPIAVALAASNPRGLMGLILCCTFIRNPRPELTPLQLVSNLLPIHMAPKFIYRHFLLGQANTPGLEAALDAAIRKVSGRAMRARVGAVLRVDVSDKMRKVQVPVLYLQAAQDRLVPPSAGAYIASIHPDTVITTIDAPHCLLQSAPHQAADEVSRFSVSPSPKAR